MDDYVIAVRTQENTDTIYYKWERRRAASRGWRVKICWFIIIVVFALHSLSPFVWEQG